MSNEILLSVFDVAKMLDRSPSTVRVYHQSGELPAVRMRDGTRIFRQRDVEKFIQRRARKQRDELAEPAA